MGFGLRNTGVGLLLLSAVTMIGQQPAAPVHLTAQQDRQRMMDLLHITSLRSGVDGKTVNYDESKAHDDAKLPIPWC